MKKTLFVASVATILASGGFIYHSYADGNSSAQTQATTSSVVTNQEAQSSQAVNNDATVNQDTQLEGTVDLSTVSANEIFIPKSVPDISSITKSNVFLTEGEIYARKTDIGLQLRTFYNTQSGSEILFTQVPATLTDEETIASLENSYHLEQVQVTKINDYTAAYVDGENRKVVHLMTSDHFYTASTITGTLDDVMNVIGQIKE